MALVRQSAATNSAPWPCRTARQALPAQLIEVTPGGSARRTGWGGPAGGFGRHGSSPRSQGPANLPSSWKVRARGSSCTVIRSIAHAPRLTLVLKQTPRDSLARRGVLDADDF